MTTPWPTNLGCQGWSSLCDSLLLFFRRMPAHPKSHILASIGGGAISISAGIAEQSWRRLFLLQLRVSGSSNDRWPHANANPYCTQLVQDVFTPCLPGWYYGSASDSVLFGGGTFFVLLGLGDYAGDVAKFLCTGKLNAGTPSYR